jgi:membrane protein implicated in regulation of membrane protease activity
MKELLELSFSGSNFIPTTLLLFILLYWIVVIIGVLDFHFLHFEVHADSHVDLHGGPDLHHDIGHVGHDVGHDASHHAGPSADHHVEGHVHIGVFAHILSFFNIGKIPFMLYMSFLIIPFWFLTFIINYQLGIRSFMAAFPFLVISFVVSLFIAKFISRPFGSLFNKPDEEARQRVNFLGKTGKVTIKVSDGKMGQVEIQHKNSPILLNAICPKGVVIEKNWDILVIDYLEEKDIYLVEPYKI